MLYVKMAPDLVDEMQLQIDLPTIVQTKAEMAILDIVLFYTMIIKKLLLLVVEAEAPLDTEQILRVEVKVEAQATMPNILLAVER